MYVHTLKGEKVVHLKKVVLAGILAVMVAGRTPDHAAQTPLATPATATAQPAAPAVSVSAQLQQALSSVRKSVDMVHVDKWKRGNIRDEASQNISQIVRDIDVTLPPLLRDADTSPASLSKLLPISRNISALYDVLLRVVEASRVIAPDEQVAQLQQALVTLGNSRLAFGDQMQTSAVAMEKQVSDLHATVQSQASRIAATPTPVAVPCTPAAPRSTTKKTSAKKPAAGTAGANPAAGTPNTKTAPATTTPPKPSPQTH